MTTRCKVLYMEQETLPLPPGAETRTLDGLHLVTSRHLLWEVVLSFHGTAESCS